MFVNLRLSCGCHRERYLALTLLAGVTFGCSATDSAGPLSGTERMALRLRQLPENLDPTRSPYANSARADAMMRANPPSDVRGRFLFEYELAEQLLFAGRFDEAIDRTQRIQQAIAEYDRAAAAALEVPAEFSLLVQRLLGMAYLRRAIRDHCVEDRRTSDCLLPLDTGGADAGLRVALSSYLATLDRHPDDLRARWLLNVACMMLGEYPDSVPTEWLIQPDAFESEYRIDRFPDVAPELGLDVVGRLGGVIMDDFDNDGNLDIMTSAWGLNEQLHYFRNNGDGSFADRTQDAGLGGLVAGMNLFQADYNNDGCLDVFVTRGAWSPNGRPNSLLRNDCASGFEDVTEDAGILSVEATLAASWGDYDNDGWIDLFVANESRDTNSVQSQLFHNNGDGTFRDVARESGAGVIGVNKGVVWGDIDNDGRLDLYVSRLGQANVMLRNLGPDSAGTWQFADVTDVAGVAEPVESFPTWFWDYNNDGWIDLFVSGYRAQLGDIAAEYMGLPHSSERPRLYRNNGNGTFSDVTTATRLDRTLFAMGANYGDLDGDGWLDFYVGTGDAYLQALIPNRMFRNSGGEFFQDVTSSGGFGHLLKGHGVAFGDLDNDGDQDIYAVMGGAYEGDLGRNVLFASPGPSNPWLTLILEGVESNRAAIGARIHVTIETPTGLRDIYRTVGSGGSFGANSLRQEIGLGNATALRRVAIVWPTTGATDEYANMVVNRAYRVREGGSRPTPIDLAAISLFAR
ncbi:MAG: CRTAC1 family protein [Gemmatimonadales bacterium]